ncbi:MAG: hydroxyacylglutathione hydrolase [Pseudomonadota bacterium]
MSSNSGSLSPSAERILRESAAATEGAPLAVALTPLFDSNYAYLLRDAASGVVGVVDPGDATPVSDALHLLGWTPDWILLTHHHADHIGGVDELRAETGAKVVGAAQDAARLPKLDAEVAVGGTFDLGETRFDVLDAPGHTIGHIAYHAHSAAALFAGDALFALGCGRLFEGTAAQMWATLSRFAALPDETKVYCGHEYTLANARFSLGIETSNAALAARAREIEALRAAGAPTIPTTIGAEKATSPFLRAAEPALQAALGLDGADPASVFAEVRRRKDAA